jgi:adenine-specific DNA-methyltransferase
MLVSNGTLLLNLGYEKILWYVKDSKNYVFNLDAIRDKNVKYPNSKRNGKLRVNTLGKNPSDNVTSF